MFKIITKRRAIAEHRRAIQPTSILWQLVENQIVRQPHPRA